MNLNAIVSLLNNGGIIAYPTEAVYGLGCDPLNEVAVTRLLELKNRSWEKGLILIGSSWQQFTPYLMPLTTNIAETVMVCTKKPITWLLPAAPFVPTWICGKHTTVAVRVTNHPLAKKLCENFNHPIVSTSANMEGQEPAKDVVRVKEIFGNKIDSYIAGSVDLQANPSEIRDGVTGFVIREG